MKCKFVFIFLAIILLWFSGLGYIVSSQVASAVNTADSWRWGMRVTPMLGFVIVLLISLFLKDPQRGQSEGAKVVQTTSWIADLKALCCQ